jgi:membrane protein required for colicin V production
VVAGLIKGLMDGFVKQLALFVALAVAIYFAGALAVPMRLFVLKGLGMQTLPLPLMTGLCYTLSFAVIVFIIVLLGKFIDLALKMTPAKPLNIIFGGAFGICVAILSLSLVLNVLTAFDSKSTIISKQAQEKSRLYEKTKDIVPKVYPEVRRYFNTQLKIAK